VQTSGFNRITFYGRRGALLETVSTFFGLQRTYDYASFGGADAIEGGESVISSATLRGGWNLAPSAGRNFVSFDPAFYGAHTVERTQGGTTDTIAFSVPRPLDDLTGVSLRAVTPTFRRFTASASVSAGRTAIFPEAAPGRLVAVTGSVDWRPAGQVRVSGQWARRAIDRSRDGSRFSTEDIPRVKVEYQATRAIFVRFVGQYVARRQAALEDGQGRPILIGGVRATAQAANDLRMDWLFSYRPVPGTLIYLGYGTSLAEPDAFAFGRLARVQDGFFGKVSWLLRG